MVLEIVLLWLNWTIISLSIAFWLARTSNLNHDITGRAVEGKLSVSAVGSIIGMQSKEIQNIAAQYAEKKAELKLEAKKAKKAEVLTPFER